MLKKMFTCWGLGVAFKWMDVINLFAHSDACYVLFIMHVPSKLHLGINSSGPPFGHKIIEHIFFKTYETSIKK